MARSDPATASALLQHRSWWESPWLWLGFAALSTVPFWVVTIPPLQDLIGHMGRYHVVTHIETSAALQRHFTVERWIMGNLGVDLLVIALQPWLGIVGATKLIASLMPPLFVAGLYAVARAVHGRISPAALLALPFAYSWPFLMGFLNFSLAAPLALLTFAAWAKLRHRPLWVRWTVFIPASCLVWLCHAAAWGLLALMIGGYELARHRPSLRGFLTAVRDALPAAAPILPMIIWRAGNATGERTWLYADDWWLRKLNGLSVILRDSHVVLDQVSLVIIGAMALTLWRLSGRTAIRPLAIGGGLCLLATVAMPNFFFSTWFADDRMWPIALTLLLLCIAGPKASHTKWVHAIAALAVLLFCVRMGATTLSWSQVDGIRAPHLAALNHVPRGARVMAMVVQPCEDPWRMTYRLNHLPSMAIVLRDAFVNSQWRGVNAFWMTHKTNADTRFGHDPSQFVLNDACGAVTTANRPRYLSEALAQFPRERYDYLWLLFNEPTQAPPLGLALAYSYPQGRLYRLTPQPTGQASSR
jgi:hypothetical protein